MRPLHLLLCLTAVVAAGAAAVSAQEVAYSGSLQFATGTYIFTEPTRTYSLQNGLTLTAGPFRLSGSVPLILQNSGAVTVVGDATLPTGGTGYTAVGDRQGGQNVPMGGHGSGRRPSILSPAIRTGDGAFAGDVVDATALAADVVADSIVEAPGPYELTVGDPFLTSALELFTGAGTLRTLEVVASVKVPLNGLDSGVGTGEWDWGAGAAATVAIGPVFAFTDLTYWWYGDLPGLELQDGISAAAGLGVPISRRVWASAMASRSNRILATAEPASSLSVGLSVATGTGTSWTLLAGSGLSETSAGFNVSLGWRLALGGD